ncbi:hypothetical protein [Streptomyces mirabilis]|uniref:hypothetical protein n=1 Tax=Streptomyces mirabilis TaxID=68239 RepID=UPI003BEF2912
MSEIMYVRGDAATPSAKGVKLIAHVCNDIGGWGKGFVLALRAHDFGSGAAHFVRVEKALAHLAAKAAELDTSVLWWGAWFLAPLRGGASALPRRGLSVAGRAVPRAPGGASGPPVCSAAPEIRPKGHRGRPEGQFSVNSGADVRWFARMSG